MNKAKSNASKMSQTLKSADKQFDETNKEVDSLNTPKNATGTGNNQFAESSPSGSAMYNNDL